MGKKNQGFSIGVLAILLLVLMFQGAEFVPPPPECNDGIDNDGDGGIDIDDPNVAFDQECQYSTTDMNTGLPNTTSCPLWMSEANPPQTLQQCIDGY